jgi:hypothetical protein
MSMNNDELQFFFKKLKNHPKLQERFSEILNITENTSGELITADEAEGKTIEEVRKLGQEVMQEWATSQQQKQAEELVKNHPTRTPIKKNSTGKRRLEE